MDPAQPPLKPWLLWVSHCASPAHLQWLPSPILAQLLVFVFPMESLFPQGSITPEDVPLALSCPNRVQSWVPFLVNVTSSKYCDSLSRQKKNWNSGLFGVCSLKLGSRPEAYWPVLGSLIPRTENRQRKGNIRSSENKMLQEVGFRGGQRRNPFRMYYRPLWNANLSCIKWSTGPRRGKQKHPLNLHPSSPVGLVADPKLLSFETEMIRKDLKVKKL